MKSEESKIVTRRNWMIAALLSLTSIEDRQQEANEDKDKKNGG